MKPTFFILGAAKCGTTSLHDYLSKHPQVCMSDPKEPFFFEAEYEKGFDFYKSRYFADWQGQPALGDARHRNLYLPYVSGRIRESVPDARLLVVLRNPVDRAYSHWWHWFSRGRETLAFEDAIALDFKRIDAGIDFEGADGPDLWTKNFDFRLGKNEFTTYIDSGYYSRQIARYAALFPADQLKVVFLEDLSADQETVVADIAGFLGLDPTFRLPPAPARNAANSKIANQLGQVARAVKVSRFLSRGAKDRLKGLANRFGSTPRLSAATRKDLLSHFRPHNQALQELTGRDLTTWMN